MVKLSGCRHDASSFEVTFVIACTESYAASIWHFCLKSPMELPDPREKMKEFFRHHVRLAFICPGKPVENAYIESFNGRLRDECLKEHWFINMAHARSSSRAGASIASYYFTTPDVEPYVGSQLDALYFTGGSTGLHNLITHITAAFPAAEAVHGDRFASVVSGLAITGSRRFAG